MRYCAYKERGVTYGILFLHFTISCDCNDYYSCHQGLLELMAPVIASRKAERENKAKQETSQ